MSLGTSNRDGGKTSESGHLRTLAKMVTGDVISGLNVSQRAAGANMSVDVAVGDAFLRRSDGTYAHPVFNDAVYNQAISVADGSNPRRDIVVLYLDYGVTPVTTVSNNTNGVIKIKVVNGTAAGSPVDPTDAAIQSSVGAGNPFTKLARVRVPTSQTSISNTLIDDLRSLTNPIEQAGGQLLQQLSETMFDFILAGTGVWSGDAYASTLNASMTALVAYQAGVRLTVPAVTAHAFTASKDTYIDILNTAGVGSVVYTEVANNAASPALAANSIRIAIIVSGANIAAVGSVNQGQANMVLPIASSVAYSVTDSLGNLICPRDPNRKLLGMKQLTTFSATSASAADVDIANLSALTVNVPSGKKIKLTSLVDFDITAGAASLLIVSIKEGATPIQSKRFAMNGQTGWFCTTSVEMTIDATPGVHTYKVSFNRQVGSGTIIATTGSTSQFKAELA